MNRRPRALVLSPDFPPGHGGIQRLVHGVVAHAAAHEPHVVTFDAPGAGEFDAGQPFAVRRVPERPHPRSLAVLRLNCVAVRAARSVRPDVVLSGHIVMSPAAWAIARRGVPVVQYLHAKELVHRPRLARLALRSAAASIAVSAYTRDLAVDLGADPERVQVIPPGIDLGAGRRDERAARPTLVTVGRLEDRHKGHDVVMRALPPVLERVPDAEWVVVGDGSLRAELEQAAAHAGIGEHVRFVGAVTDDERDAWLDRAHVYVMPARVPERVGGGEGFGIVYLEAGAHRLPVVAGGVGGVLDAVTEETGVLVDPTDERAVAQAVCDLLLDHGRARRLGEAGYERAKAHAWPVIADRVERVLLDAGGR